MLLPKQILALARITAKVSSRYAFSSIRIERHERGPRAMATDSRRAVIFSWDEPDPGQFPPIDGLSPKRVRGFAANVPARTLADASRGIPSRLPIPILGYLLLDESDASVVRVATTSGDHVTRAQAKAEEAAFPDIDEVLATPARDGKLYDPQRHGEVPFTHTRIGVNARQLAETLLVLAELAGDDANHTVVMTVPVSANRPIRLDARTDGRRATAAVMPVNFTACDEDWPAERKSSGASQAAEASRKATAAVPRPAAAITPPTESRIAPHRVKHARRLQSARAEVSAVPTASVGVQEATPSVRRPASRDARRTERRTSLFRSLRNLF